MAEGCRMGTGKKCPCGSGLICIPQEDARGIFLCFTCEKCEVEKFRRYRPDVLSDPNYGHDEPIDEDC